MNDKRMSAADLAYEQLKAGMIEWTYPPSSSLREEQLSKDLEISRTPLRQALYRLELEGFVVKQPNGRMMVAPITLQEAREVFQVRELLESLVAREAAENMTEEHLYRLEDVVELMRRAVNTNRSDEIVKHGEHFHHILHSLSTNDTNKRFLQQLQNKIDRYRRISGYKNPGYSLQTPLDEHEGILQLLKAGKTGKEVEEAMRAHIRRSLVSIEETIEQYERKGLKN
ncbi:GntR family transcriptional regulator [Natribacillus halophilus]|uniref:DNA-binding transcriptional regulator, GntR family n=1 Tax=Natribacillus halophilus TaxID=549003 RepID=A0A1G8Q385_9BACI|nr:GntR family transcriptional regulator [Natribacillus halophilus]SDI99224.1 DNA-binding transcriptional regulator, GntR family [Natribacillus halophilus]